MPKKKEKAKNILTTGHMVNYRCTLFSQNNRPGFSICTPSSRSSLTPGRFSGNTPSLGNRPHADIMEWSASWLPWLSIGRRVARAVSPSSGRAGRRNARGRPPFTARLRLARRVARTPMVLAPPAGSRQTTGGTFRRLVRQLRFARVFTAIIQPRTAERAQRLAAVCTDRCVARPTPERGPHHLIDTEQEFLKIKL